jgi:hypothetical protein
MRALPAIGVVVFHLEVKTGVGVEQHQPVGADTKAPVAEEPDPFVCQRRIAPAAVVQDDEVIAGARGI